MILKEIKARDLCISWYVYSEYPYSSILLFHSSIQKIGKYIYNDEKWDHDGDVSYLWIIRYERKNYYWNYLKIYYNQNLEKSIWYDIKRTLRNGICRILISSLYSFEKINSFLLKIQYLKIIKKIFHIMRILNYHILFLYIFDIASINNSRRISSILNWFSYDLTLIN